MGNHSETSSNVHHRWWLWFIVVFLFATCIYFLFFNKSIETSTVTTMTAEEITEKLKSQQDLNIGEIVVYTEETDTNELLGRPNSYISKTVFAITTLTQPTKMSMEQLESDSTLLETEKQKFLLSNNEPVGGTIEVFSCKEDMQKRKDYLSSMMSSGNAFTSSSYAYIYSKDCALLRISREITPTNATQYENAFNNIMDNK